jgi:hypothetical protein
MEGKVRAYNSPKRLPAPDGREMVGVLFSTAMPLPDFFTMRYLSLQRLPRELREDRDRRFQIHCACKF